MAAINDIQLDLLTKQVDPSSGKSPKTESTEFSDSLKSMIQQVDDLQKASGEQIKSFISGEQGNLHEVMASAEEARLSFQLMMEVRNKLLESYHELIRMQV